MAELIMPKEIKRSVREQLYCSTWIVHLKFYVFYVTTK